MTNTGPSVVNSDIGIHTGTAVTGCGDATVNRQSHVADGVAQIAKADAANA